ncbi:glycosyl transferase family 2 [Polaribacter reichenbachii]|uniref:glycosyltransferase n=1 Tax=Polaribacter reichenbachii TaxID=996801 RepID=UPI00097381E0|nr:glycosyltransferase [Polaribacter reichenbachii]APZ45134.1 glycosyl transferase family 2 [Polaribacter reichenbachii]AUC18996.1 glycosyl transferase family 2 [Polaribacter reichenbachii]
MVPVLNNLNGLKKTIKSIKNQSFKDFEVWVIDGNSNDETQEYLNGLNSPFFFHSEVDKGIYDAMNKGISLSKGEWLYFMGAEDIFFDDNTLNEVFRKINLENCLLVSGRISYQGVVNPFVYSKNKIIKNPSWSALMWLRNGLHHQGTFYKKILFIDEKYPLKFKTLSDYWFNLYLFKRKAKCKVIHKTIAKCTSDGVSKNGKWELYKEEINLKTELSSRYFVPFFYFIALSKFLSRKIVND